MKALIGCALNVLVISGLVSGIDVLHDAAFAVCIILQVIAWPCMLIVVMSKPHELREILFKYWYLKMPFTIAFWFTLAYSGHPYLLASSIIFYVLAASVAASSKKVAA